MPLIFLAIATLNTKVAAGEFQFSVKYLETKETATPLFFQKLPPDAQVLGSLTISAELGKKCTATAQIDKRTLGVSIFVQKVWEDGLTVELQAESTFDRDSGRDCWKNLSTIGIRLGKPWGFWSGSRNGIRSGILVLVTERSQEKKVDEPANDSPSKVGSIFSFANKLVATERSPSLEQRLIPEILRSKASETQFDFFEIQWAQGWEASPKYPFLYDGLQYEILFSP
jgi:hypothetical protein